MLSPQLSSWNCLGCGGAKAGNAACLRMDGCSPAAAAPIQSPRETAAAQEAAEAATIRKRQQHTLRQSSVTHTDDKRAVFGERLHTA